MFLGSGDEEQDQNSPPCGSDAHTRAHRSLCSAHRDRSCRDPHWRPGQEGNAQLHKNHQQLTSTFYSINEVTDFNQVCLSFCTQNKRGNSFFPGLFRVLYKATTPYEQRETYSVVLLFPFGFRCCSSISPGLQVWLRGVFSGAGFRGSCCPGGAGGDSFRRRFPAPRCRRGSRAHGRQGSACWRWCLHRDQKELWSLGLCCSGFHVERRSSSSPSTLSSWSRMSSVTRLRISSGLRPARVFPFLLCTSLMKPVKSELEGQERQDQGWHVGSTAGSVIPAGSKDSNFSHELEQVPALSNSQ